MPDRKEHKKRMKERRERQLAREPDVPWYDGWRKQWLPEYRKSIWPDGKTAKPGRMG